MSPIKTLPDPAWVRARPTPLEQDEAQLCFLIRLAALFHNETGSIVELSKAMNMSETVLHMAMKRGQVTAAVAIALEQVLGVSLFPWQMFRPDLVVNAE